jgi:hypothetical protein
MVGLLEPECLSKSDEKLCTRIAQITSRKKLPERSKHRIYAAIRATSTPSKWRS